MKLYFSPGVCSRAAHIILHETGIEADLVQVDIRAHKLVANGADYYAVNPKGYVPALELDDGSLLTENIAILSYLGDRAGLLAKSGDMARYHTIEWLAFVSTEVHKSFTLLFNPTAPEAGKAIYLEKLASRFALLDAHLADHAYIAGDFGIVDAYAFTVLSWTAPLDIDISGYPNLCDYLKRVADRPSVQAAIAAES